MHNINSIGWTSLEDFFNYINKNTNYVILRNFEELSHDFLSLEHPDIDFLCSDRTLFLLAARSVSRTRNINDQVHRYIVVNNKRVDIDVRCVGDGYYDSIWEKDILNTRELFLNMFYVPNKFNYFYSLLYHTIIQKDIVSDDYAIRLNIMAKEVGIKDGITVNIGLLQSFMRQKGYMFTYPENPRTKAHFDNVDRRLIKTNYKRQIQRWTLPYKNIFNHILKLWEKR